MSETLTPLAVFEDRITHVLRAVAIQQTTITFTDLANAVGWDRRYPDGRPILHVGPMPPLLDLIAATCAEQGLPPLTALVVRKDGEYPPGLHKVGVPEYAVGVAIDQCWVWGASLNSPEIGVA